MTPSYADNKRVTWQSSDEKVATVDENGKVTAVGNGTATITATSVSRQLYSDSFRNSENPCGNPEAHHRSRERNPDKDW